MSDSHHQSVLLRMSKPRGENLEAFEERPGQDAKYNLHFNNPGNVNYSKLTYTRLDL